MKPEGPFVLTHEDVNTSNIMVKDGHVSGIIDWEDGGYMPELWEWIKCRIIQEDEWACYLREEMVTRKIGSSLTERKYLRMFKRYRRVPRSGIARPLEWHNKIWLQDNNESYLDYISKDLDNSMGGVLANNQRNAKELEYKVAEHEALKEELRTAEKRARGS